MDTYIDNGEFHKVERILERCTSISLNEVAEEVEELTKMTAVILSIKKAKKGSKATLQSAGRQAAARIPITYSRLVLLR